jgi:hypothetical protein
VLFFLLLLGREIGKLGACVNQGFAKLRERNPPPVIDIAKLARVVWAVANPESHTIGISISAGSALITSADHPILRHNFPTLRSLTQRFICSSPIIRGRSSYKESWRFRGVCRLRLILTTAADPAGIEQDLSESIVAAIAEMLSDAFSMSRAFAASLVERQPRMIIRAVLEKQSDRDVNYTNLRAWIYRKPKCHNPSLLKGQRWLRRARTANGCRVAEQ